MSDDCQGGENYDIGYGRPPRETQFKKGQSGNPNGRPKGKKKDLHDHLMAALDREIFVKDGDSTKTMTSEEAMAEGIVRDAIKGDFKCRKLILDLKKQDLLSHAQEIVIRQVIIDNRSKVENTETDALHDGEKN